MEEELVAERRVAPSGVPAPSSAQGADSPWRRVLALVAMANADRVPF